VVLVLLICLCGMAVYIRYKVKIKSRKASAYGHAIVGDESSGEEDEFDDLLPGPSGPPRSDPHKWRDKVMTKADRRREKKEQREFEKFMKMADPMMDMELLGMMSGGRMPPSAAGMAAAADPALYDAETPMNLPSRSSRAAPPQPGVPSLNLGQLGGPSLPGLDMAALQGPAGPPQMPVPSNPMVRKLPTFGKDLHFEGMGQHTPRYAYTPGRTDSGGAGLGSGARQRQWPGA